MRRPLVLAALALAAFAQTPAPSHFVLLGDRTGETQPGVWEQVWKQVMAEKPAFVAGVGDTIQGGKDATAETEWQQAERSFPKVPLYLAPGNHDIWSAASEKLFEKYAHHPLHYSFDQGGAHFTVLDTSRSDQMPPAELAFLEADLQQHSSQPLKFIISHRPTWIIEAATHNSQSPLHQLARKYGVRYIVAGHVHQMLHIEFDGITYLSLPSAGGHLRASGKYEDGWFFGFTTVDTRGTEAALQIHELGPPYGQGRVTSPADWGLLGLLHR